MSIGYEKRSVAEVILLLREHGVSKLVDVREAPISRRQGFCKVRFSEELGQAGIKYCHIRPAGNPHRKDGESIEDCLQLYRGYLADNPGVVHLVADELVGSPVAVLCYERSHECCHRSILLETLTSAGYTLEVVKVE